MIFDISGTLNFEDKPSSVVSAGDSGKMNMGGCPMAGNMSDCPMGGNMGGIMAGNIGGNMDMAAIMRNMDMSSLPNMDMSFNGQKKIVDDNGVTTVTESFSFTEKF